MVQPTAQQKFQHKYSKAVFKFDRQVLLKRYKLHKIFNKNSVKVSYSCIENMKSVITAHN